MREYPSPGPVLFVTGFVAALCWFAAALAYVSAPGVEPIRGLAVALAVVGLAFAVTGAVAASILWVLGRRRGQYS